MATTTEGKAMTLSMCKACGTIYVGTTGYCADCVASGQAAYDIADRRGDRAAMAAADTAGE